MVPNLASNGLMSWYYPQVYQMLKSWKERDGDEATAEVLERALADCGMHDAAIIVTSY